MKLALMIPLLGCAMALASIVIWFATKASLALWLVQFGLYGSIMIFTQLLLTFCIRIVADCGTRFFQVTTKFYAGYNIHIYNYFGYYFYTLLGFRYFFSPIQTFLSDLLDLKLLNSGLKCDMICQKKIRGHKITAMSLAQTPRVGYQNVGNVI